MFIFGFGKKKIIDTFSNIINKPYQLLLKLRGKNVTSFILHVDNKGLYLSKFEPLQYNSLVAGYVTVTGVLEYVHKFILIRYTINSRFLKMVELDGETCYLFSLPKKLPLVKRKYEILPSKGDNITIEFNLKNIPQYKKIIKITEQYLFFEGNYLHRSEFFNQVIYGIKVKLPLRRFTVSAKFVHSSNNLYAFENYLVNSDIREAVYQYATQDYIFKNNIYYLQNPNDRQIKKTSKRKNSSIFIINKSNTISLIISKVFTSDSFFSSSIFENLEGIESKIISKNPFLIIVDDEFISEGKEVFSELTKKFPKLYFLILYDKISTKIVNYEKKDKVFILKKPFDLSEFEAIVEQIYAKYSIKKYIPKGTKFLICSRDKEKVLEIENKLRNKVFEVVTAHSVDEIFFILKKEKFQVFILNQEINNKYILTTINRIKQNSEDNYLIIFINNDKYFQSIISSIDDDKIYLFKNFPTINEILEIVENKLGVEK